jgi:hypothetical protein
MDFPVANALELGEFLLAASAACSALGADQMMIDR